MFYIAILSLICSLELSSANAEFITANIDDNNSRIEDENTIYSREDLINTKSYQNLNKLFNLSMASWLTVSLLYSLYYDDDIKDTINTILSLGLGQIILPFYGSLLNVLPSMANKCAFFMPKKGINGYSLKEIMGIYYFLEERCKISLLGFSLSYLVNTIKFPFASASEVCKWPYEPFNKNNVTCSRVLTSICGEESINTQSDYALSFIFINPKPKTEGKYLFGCLSQERDQFDNRFVKPILEWSKEYNSTVIIWIDNSLLSREMIENSQKFLCDKAYKQNIDTSKIFFRDINDIFSLKEKKLLSANIYWLVDATRIASAVSIIDEYPFNYVANIDLDIPLISSHDLFSVYNKMIISKKGLSLTEAVMYWPSIDIEDRFCIPGIQIIGNNANLDLIKKILLNVPLKSLARGGVDKDFEYLLFHLYEYWNFISQLSDNEKARLIRKDLFHKYRSKNLPDAFLKEYQDLANLGFAFFSEASIRDVINEIRDIKYIDDMSCIIVPHDTLQQIFATDRKPYSCD